uniref:Tudor domain-containing protein n=1 Tax=Syphacia muris TaxID=451379 RepID=A0A0N5ATW6_9BILA
MYGGRSSSPIFRKIISGKKVEFEMLPNGYWDDNKFKIHRLQLTRSMSCTVSHIISPSCICLKPLNHITEQLLCSDLHSLEKPSFLREKQYVLAPISEGLYARARIISKCEKFMDPTTGKPLSFSRVHFIDEGFCRWVSDCCLAEMDEKLFYYPYQTIATTLFRVSPKYGVWNTEDVDLLKAILMDYKIFLAKVVVTKDPYVDYSEYLRVELFADTDEHRNSLASIAPEFFRRALSNGHRIEYDRGIYDGFDQRIFPVYDDENELSLVAYENMQPWEKTFPENIGMLDIYELRSDSDDQADLLENVDEEMPSVDENYLKNQGYWGDDGRLYINVEGAHTQSPYEFYGRFLKVVNQSQTKRKTFECCGDGVEPLNNCALRDGLDDEDPMMAADSVLKKLAEELNNFYGFSRNRKMIKAIKVKKALANKRSIFGVVEVSSYLARFTGSWQRVEVLGLKGNMYARVRYIDTGGTDIVLLSSVLQLHTRFYSQPPLCFQMCICDIIPTTGNEWSKNAKKFFSCELRDDVPISLRLWSDMVQFGYDCPPHLRKNVALVSDLQVMDMKRELWIEKLLISEGYAVFAGDKPLSTSVVPYN